MTSRETPDIFLEWELQSVVQKFLIGMEEKKGIALTGPHVG